MVVEWRAPVSGGEEVVCWGTFVFPAPIIQHLRLHEDACFAETLLGTMANLLFLFSRCCCRRPARRSLCVEMLMRWERGRDLGEGERQCRDGSAKNDAGLGGRVRKSGCHSWSRFSGCESEPGCARAGKARAAQKGRVGEPRRVVPCTLRSLLLTSGLNGCISVHDPACI